MTKTSWLRLRRCAVLEAERNERSEIDGEGEGEVVGYLSVNE